MICVERGYLEPRYENAVWELLVSSDKEFVPPLSARGSTRQKELGPGAVPGTDVPKAYFEDIKKQSMIVAVSLRGARDFRQLRVDDYRESGVS